MNLDHLELGTKGDNNRDRKRDGTQTRGSRHHNAKLTEEQVREADRLACEGRSFPEIGQIMGENGRRLYDAVIHKNGSWSHVETRYRPEKIDVIGAVDLTGVESLVSLGVPASKIARDLGISTSLLTYHLRKRRASSS